MTVRTMRVLIRADGDAEIGTGHVMRTLALAERVVADGGQATLLSSKLDEGLRRRVAAAGVALKTSAIDPGSAADASAVIAAAASCAAHWVIVDNYAADTGFYEALHDAGRRVLVIDDGTTRGGISADILVNQNVAASRELYNGRLAGEPRVLLGPSHALLRAEFTSIAATHAIPERAAHVLITLGGADPDNVSRAVLAALLPRVRDPAAGLSLTVVVGGSNPHRDALAREAIGDECVEFRHSVEHMAPLMARADIAVTGAGITVYELLALGIPTYVIPIVPSQRAGAAALARSGVCEAFDEASFDARRFAERLDGLRQDQPRRRAMSRAGRELVDGRGVERVIAAMMS